MGSFLNADQPVPVMEGSPPSLIIPRLDWDRPPWNRWAFQHIREILPTAEVWKGAGAASALPTRAVDFGPELDRLLDATYTDGFLVLHRGEIVCERYFNGMGPRSLHLSQSVAKSVVGTAFGILAGRGLMSTAAQVTDYLPELVETAWRGATMQQVLDMTTGVRYSENYTDRYSDVGQTDVASGWKPVPTDADPAFRWPRHMFEQILGLTDLQGQHGSAFAYRSIESDVLAFAMERATGKRLPQIISEEIWQKIGADESAGFTLDPAGYALASGGFNATLRDYARLGRLWLSGGGGIIPKDWIEDTRHGNHGMFGEPYSYSLPRGAYHNQFWIEDPESRAIMARGVFGQLIYINWDYGMVAVKLSSWPDFLSTDFSNATLAELHRIGRTLMS